MLYIFINHCCVFPGFIKSNFYSLGPVFFQTEIGKISTNKLFACLKTFLCWEMNEIPQRSIVT